MTTVAVELEFGDCILHRTHHEMSTACWDAVADHTFEIMTTRQHATIWESRNLYKWRYEQAVLADLVVMQYERDF